MLATSLRISRSMTGSEPTSGTMQSRATIPLLTDPNFWARPLVRKPNEPDLRDLNTALLALAEIFPDVRPEVFREMLSSLSEDSRLHVVADQLLHFGPKWIRGRWRISSKRLQSKILNEVLEVEGKAIDDIKELVPLTEQFRTRDYKSAVEAALQDEFRNLSKSTIQGVLAEQNFSYTNSRPVLAGLAAKSWRINFKALIKWRKPSTEHFMLIPAKSPVVGALRLPQLKKTGCAELDVELYETVLKPVLEEDARTKGLISQELAVLLNDADAKENGAIYECECCFDEVAFESIVICSIGEHILCFKCVQNTVSAALYSQAWTKTVDHKRSAITCFAPGSLDCAGCIPNELTQRALSQMRGGLKTWEKLEQKFASEARLHSKQLYHECPFCTYAEVDDVYWPAGTPNYRFRLFESFSDFVQRILMLIVGILLVCQYYWLSLLFVWPPINELLAQSLKTLARKNSVSLKFHCLNPVCNRYSCLACRTAWHDPHLCNEKESISLRTCIEAAKSAATKRVCPKCNLSFVKESGCNKMTCTCGYTMCYLCRQGLGQSANKDNPHDDHDYSHFCGHFRAFPGRCVQCDKCDLYREGNQEEIVRKAGENAEKEWKANQKKKTGETATLKHGTAEQDSGMEMRLQALADMVVQTFVTC